MVCSGVEHKLRVFISSKCGGKYTITRKALKELLYSTGLIEVYAFEMEPASSEDTISSYLENVDQSDLCIFIVDNADGVPAAVLSEEKRAKDKNLRLLYLFCDEIQREPTAMQKEIRTSLSCKYYVVHEFADVVKKAFDSVMQDLIAIYRRVHRGLMESDSIKEDTVSQDSFLRGEADIYSLQKERYPISEYMTQVLRSGIFPVYSSENAPTPTDLEVQLANQLKAVLYRDAFNEDSFSMLKKEILNAQDLAIKTLVSKRLDAQFYYFKAEYEKCLELLQEALKIAINSNSIPTWLVNDVAIDIRHIVGRIDDLKNIFSTDNPGQKVIDESSESVFYPYLDRQIENMQEAIADRYYNELSRSPYTTQWGGLDGMFMDLATAFCIAEMHGSIVQTVICREHLISITLMLCTLYDDHDFVVELIRLLVIGQESKKLDSLIRTYNQSVEILNDTDVKRILNSVLCIDDEIRMYKSKYLLMSRLGYYMGDTLYHELYHELVSYAFAWVHNEHAVMSLSKYIFDFFRENIHRTNLDHPIEFICNIFNGGNRSTNLYLDSYKILQNINYSEMSVASQRQLRTLLIDICSGKYNADFDNYFLSACTRFCKFTTIPFKRLEKALAKKYPNYYKETFKLEMLFKKKDDPIEYISPYLEEAKSRNNTQGKGGHYSGYTYEPYDVIYNILTFSNTDIDEELLTNILDSLMETLEETRQTISAKIAAIKLIQLLFYKTNSAEIWRSIEQRIIDNRDIFTVGYEMNFLSIDTTNVLTFLYDVYISTEDSRFINQVIDNIFSFDHRDSVSIIKCLSIIGEYLQDGIGDIFSPEILEALFHFCMMMAQHRERDIKYS